MRRGSLLLLCMALAPSLASGQTITCDRFDARAVLQGNELVVSLDTDLPNSTQVMVSNLAVVLGGQSNPEVPP